MRGAVAVLAMTFLIVLTGCSETRPKPPADFTEYLDSFGQVFTPQSAPATAGDWAGGIPSGFPIPGAMVDTAVYGVVTCVDPSKNCAMRGLVRPGESLEIWVLGFAHSGFDEGCPMWATIDGRTGSFINGQGPPC